MCRDAFDPLYVRPIVKLPLKSIDCETTNETNKILMNSLRPKGAKCLPVPQPFEQFLC